MEIALLILMLLALVVLAVIFKDQQAIHVMVNSNLTSVKADLKIALDRIQTLERLLTQEDKEVPA